MELTKVILDYLRTLVWPAVALITLILFGAEIKTMIGRVEKVNAGPVTASFGSGRSEDAAAKSDRKAPDIWFDINKYESSQSECVTSGADALKKAGYSGVITEREIAYGYDSEFVGMIWCSERDRLSLIAVAGPGSKNVRDRQFVLAEKINIRSR